MVPVQRVFPQIMKSQPVMEAAIVKEVTGVDKKELVTSRVENINEGYCPVCGEMLSPTQANGLDVLACFAHNIVMPVRDR